jgi:hypothetical protein
MVYVPLMTPQASETWSRGRLVGMTPVNLRVDIQPAPEGGVFLAWADSDNRLHLAHLGAQGEVISDRKLALEAAAPHEPLLLLGANGEIHLFWREVEGSRSQLTYAQLDDTAAVQVAPFSISPAGDEALSVSVTFNRQGAVEVLWAGRLGIYRAVITAAGELAQEPTLLIEGGEQLATQVDRRGNIHLAWVQREESIRQVIYYAVLDPSRAGRAGLSEPEEMARPFLRVGQSVQSLAIALDDESGYIVWSVQDLRYVASTAQYAAFPVEIPRQKRVRDFELETGSNPSNFWALRGQHETALVALTETVVGAEGPQLQIGVAVLHGEQPGGDQVQALRGGSSHSARLLIPRPAAPVRSVDGQVNWPEAQYVVTASNMASLKPTLVLDSESNFHATWLETGGFGVYRIAYASTSEVVRQAYNRPTLWDMTDRALAVAMKFFLAVGLTPVLAIYWMLLPLMWLFVYLFLSGQEHIKGLGTWVAFGVAVVLEVASTYFIYHPHRSVLSPLMQSVLPLVTAACGVGLALLYLWRRDQKSLFGAFFVFAIVHGVLQVLVFVMLR